LRYTAVVIVHAAGVWRFLKATVVEFDSLEQARKFYHSAEYQAARAARKNAAEMNILVVEGLPI
jgi:uncharacterized protein (DUF1330 family)